MWCPPEWPGHLIYQWCGHARTRRCCRQCDNLHAARHMFPSSGASGAVRQKQSPIIIVIVPPDYFEPWHFITAWMFAFESFKLPPTVGVQLLKFDSTLRSSAVFVTGNMWLYYIYRSYMSHRPCAWWLITTISSITSEASPYRLLLYNILSITMG